MAEPKGYVGYMIVGDKSVEFYRDPVMFVNKRMEEYDTRIFQSRILNKPTVFIGTIQGVQDLVGDCSHNFEMGYKVFMHGLYGDNAVFAEGEEAARLGQVLHSLFEPASMHLFNTKLKNLISKHFSNLDAGTEVSAYEQFKHFATELSFSIFLDVVPSHSAEVYDQLSQLITTHWHGIISVPLSLKLPYWGSSSGYNRALEAKGELLEIIRDRLEKANKGDFLHHISEAGFQNQSEVENHLLLFISALVPKAFASILTSFTLALSGHDKAKQRHQASIDCKYLDHVLLEVQRLWPPFFGGRRLTRKSCVLDGVKVHKGTAVVYMTNSAHRDPKVFTDPEEFKPERWDENGDELEKLLCCFGGGKRKCIGIHLIKNILKEVCTYLLNNYEWSVSDDQDLTYKWLPVSRPIGQLMTQFVSKGNQND
ncbi:putative cytochrome P450 120 [Anneissia japonica]|uniref:putative cytochrome P450 120 n=1 Tax=Anneissia japonica TaxID=1529436 RepID=UPI0014257BE7|nr:putative cytochrome P450 120 [Anneissia japonica]